LHEKECFERLGHEVKLIVFHTSPIGFPEGTAEFISLNNTDAGILKLMRLNRKLNKVVLNRVREVAPDVIYFRDRGAILNFFNKLSKIAPVYVEVQSNMIEEFKIINKKRYILEKILRRRYYKKIRSFVCITNELYKNEKKYNNKSGYILGNGILEEDLGLVRKTGFDDKIHLVFIISPGLPWHGTERLLRSLNNAPNKDKFFIHIVGEENKSGLLYKNVLFYGIVNDRHKLDEIFAQSDIGIGTLALYTKNMKEAAPLKIRNYIAKGLPVILGYDDVDLPKSMNFVYSVPNDDTDLNFEDIERFYEKTKNYRASGEISKYAEEYLLWSKKIKVLSEYISDTYNSNIIITRSNVNGDITY
jgi:hypothetical protein